MDTIQTICLAILAGANIVLATCATLTLLRKLND